MQPLPWFSELSDVWLLAVLSIAGLLWSGRCLSRARWGEVKLSSLHRNQEGGAYTLNFVLALFCLFLFICVMIECVQIFLAKTGTVYSAFAAARTAIVHSHTADRDRMAERAAVRSFVPFSRGLVKYDPEPLEVSGDSPLWTAYESIDGQPVNQKYFRNKENSAGRRVEVSITDQAVDDPTGSLKVEVRYRYPLMFPFLGVVLGQLDGPEYYRELSALVCLPKESPQSEDQQLGIEYDGD